MVLIIYYNFIAMRNIKHSCDFTKSIGDKSRRKRILGSKGDGGNSKWKADMIKAEVEKSLGGKSLFGKFMNLT